MKAQMSMNDTVTVQLTEIGISILRERHYEFQKWMKERNEHHVIADYVAPEHGMYTDQLWCLFQYFGEHFVMGKIPPFYMYISLHQVASGGEQHESNRHVSAQ